jgi:MoaA/NifB/PqqE/SkfB family radical SAM enzyme
VVSLAEAGRRALGRRSGQLHSLPILALSVHSACNCRCVMCDIWKANAEKRDISADDLCRHLAAIRQLRVQRVMLTGGEPLLHRNLWALCDMLQESGVRLTLVTTGLLIEQHATEIARSIDELVVSIDGPPSVHDEIRRVRGGFARIAQGLQTMAVQPRRPHTIARSVVQRANCGSLADTVRAAHASGIDRLSFLAADVSTHAFNRPEPWDEARRAEIAVPGDALPLLAEAIGETESICRDASLGGFIAGGIPSLWRIYDYYRALAGLGDFPRVRCNAPWVSAVLEPGGEVRPCFFHAPYEAMGEATLDETLNSAAARAFRRELDVRTNDVCRRCVCSLSLPLWAEA